MFSRGWVRVRAVLVNRWLFCSSSHSGWCRLKSPSQTKDSGRLVHSRARGSRKYVLTAFRLLLFLQSLYMFMTRIVLNSPWSWTAVTSGESMMMGVHESVDKRLLAS